MTLRVIGSGMGRTGTMSLKLALEKLLGGPCYHMVEVFQKNHFHYWTAAARGEKVDWAAVFDGYVAAVDWPAAAFWEEISAFYPDALILHSERDPEKWWKSASDTIFKERPQPPPPPMQAMLEALFTSRFTPQIRDKAASIAAYNKNNAHVHATAPKARLSCWKPGDGWEPICKALGLPVPAEPFPHVNTTDEFTARIAAGVFPGASGPGTTSRPQ